MKGILTVPSAGVPAGTSLFTARYLGNATFSASVSSPIPVTVYSGNAPATTTTSLASSANPATLGQPVTFTATVKASGKAAATGTVTFYVDGSPIGSAALTPGKSVSTAQRTGVQLTAGSHVVSAIYIDAQTFAASGSAPLTQVVQ